MKFVFFRNRNGHRRRSGQNHTIFLSKRQEFVLITLGLMVGLLLTQLVPVELRYILVFILSLFSYIFGYFGLREDIKGIEKITLLTLPTLFTAAVSLFYFLLPVRWLTRVPVVVLYGVGFYALLLTENIYNVAAARSIALLRAAHSVGFLLSLVTFFLLFLTILSFHLSIILTAFSSGALSFFLILQALWALELEERASRRVWNITIMLTAVFTEIAWMFSFWPVKIILVALFGTTCFYSLVGMAQQYLVDKLYKKTAIEFLGVVGIVFLIVLFASHWRGAV